MAKKKPYEMRIAESGTPIRPIFREIEFDRDLGNVRLFSHDPGGLAGILGVLQLNVCAKRLMEHFTGFSLSTRSIGHGLFDADDLMALRALAEAMAGAIHFVPWSKPTRVG
jgi:hypothetical protein